MPPSFSANSEPFVQSEVDAYSRLLAESFEQWTGKRLVPHNLQLAATLYHAPFTMFSHDTQDDPIFRYANLTAQKLWGIDSAEFVRMPSRLTAEPVATQERQSLLDEAPRTGYVDHYKGVRVSKEGNGRGVKHGQAAMIKRWEWL